MPHDLPPWEAVYQQTRRWLEAGVFEEMVHDFFARTLLATFGGRSARSDGDHTGLPHPAIHAGERLSGRLRRGEAQEGYEGTRGGGYPGTLARLARDTGR